MGCTGYVAFARVASPKYDSGEQRINPRGDLLSPCKLPALGLVHDLQARTACGFAPGTCSSLDGSLDRTIIPPTGVDFRLA